MEFVIEYNEYGPWERDTSFSDITLAEKMYKKNIEEMPEFKWRLILVVKDYDYNSKIN